MAKRRRLDVSDLSVGSGADPGLETKSITRLSGIPPIADVAGQAAAISAAEGAVAEIAAARADGRLVIRVPLEAVDPDHLVRDRVRDRDLGEDEDMAALKASIATHGQRMPVELIDKGQGRFGLISGWRRLTALAALRADTGEARFGEVLAILRQPADAGAAYVAMVEENEIRVGLSYYERARIAAMAAARGAFADTEAAINALYAAGSKARRSKIRAFLLIHEVLGQALSFPAHLPERLGLRLVQAIREGGTAALLAALDPPADSPEAEAAALAGVLAGVLAGAKANRKRDDKPGTGTIRDIAPGIALTVSRSGGARVLKIEGPGVTADLEARLAAFLRTL